MAERPRSYEEFWPRYLSEHAKPATRSVHMAGTGLGIALFAAGVATLDPWLCLAAFVCGYVFAWLAHLAIERNRPTTFAHPWWSILSDFRMLFLWLGGGLGRHLDRCGMRRGVRRPEETAGRTK